MTPLKSAVLRAFAIPILALMTWPIPTLVPGPGLDPSWQAGLHLAVLQRIAFGTEFVFSYGPLGFLGQPRLFSSITGGMAFAFTGLVHIAWCCLLLTLARRAFPLIVALPLAYLVASVVVEPAEIAGLAGFLVVTALAAGNCRAGITMSAIAGALAGAMLLVKFNSGVALTLLGLAVPFLQRRRLLLGTAVYGASAVAALVLAWMVTRNPLSSIPAFVATSVEMATGYSDAMALEEAGRSWEYVAAVLLTAGILLAGARLVVLPQRRHRLVLLAIGFTGMWMLFKRGFTRHDAHSVSFFLGCAVLPLAFRWRAGVAGRTVPAFLIVTGVLAAMAAYRISPSVHLSPRRHASLALDQARTLLDGERRGRAMELGRQDILRTLALEPETVNALQGGTVHVDPTEASAVWALRLPWKPVPVFQSYVAYTEHLDDKNAFALAAPARAPGLILRSLAPLGLDGRNPDFESPGYVTTLLCYYQERSASSGWQVVARRANRCGTPRSLGHREVRKGRTIEVPQGEADEIVFAQLRFHPSVADQLQSRVFKPLDFPEVVLEGRRHRLVAATAGNPLLLRVPETLGFTPPFGGPATHAPVGRLQVEDARAVDLEFFAMRLSPVPP